MLEVSFLRRFLPSLDFDLEKKIVEPVRIHHGLAEPRWALTHTGSVKEKEFEGFYFQNHSYHLIRIRVQSK